jgi:hypothetical protein
MISRQNFKKRVNLIDFDSNGDSSLLEHFSKGRAFGCLLVESLFVENGSSNVVS